MGNGSCLSAIFYASLTSRRLTISNTRHYEIKNTSCAIATVDNCDGLKFFFFFHSRWCSNEYVCKHRHVLVYFSILVFVVDEKVRVFEDDTCIESRLIYLATQRT